MSTLFDLTNLPEKKLLAVELYRRGEASREDVAEAAAQMAQYTRDCKELSDRFGRLKPAPLDDDTMTWSFVL
ncbi:MAG: hypothetical protein OHK0046_47650 [Anaerolineae bacterium]